MPMAFRSPSFCANAEVNFVAVALISLYFVNQQCQFGGQVLKAHGHSPLAYGAVLPYIPLYD